MGVLRGSFPLARAVPRGIGGLGALLMMAALALGVAGAAEPLEYAVKAAYLSKFGGYVEWPSAALTAGAPMSLCVVGDDPFGPVLDEVTGAQRIGGRPIVVRRVRTVTSDAGCHILYIGSGEAPRVGQILDAVRSTGVLTVTDGRAPGASAGVINFVIKDNRVRFEIDEQAAAQNNLSISSKLLSLAVNVKPRR